MQEKEVLENLEELEKRKKIRKFLIISIICVLFAIIIFLGVSIYLYFQSPEKTLGLGAEIESFLISEDGKTAYIKLLGGSLDKNITKIKFLFYDSDGNEYVYETSEGIKEIEVPYSRSFWDWLLGRQFVGEYDYQINADEIGLENFLDVENVTSKFEFQTETGEVIETPVLDTRTTTTRTTTTSGGSGPSGGGNPPITSCTPNCTGKTCGDDNCGGSCGSCSSGYFCNASWVCEEIIIQTTNNITQWGITWTFDREYQYGKFVNGDYWVIGPVTIINITPASTDIDGRIMNGAMINPSALNEGVEAHYPASDQWKSNTQGFDTFLDFYDADLNVARPNGTDLTLENPLIISDAASLLSSKTYADDKGVYPQVEEFAVLTILTEVPPANSFRPGISAIDKSIKYNLDDINYSVLGRLDTSRFFPPPLSRINDKWKYPLFHWKHVDTSASSSHYPFRGETNDVGQDLLLLNSDFTDAEKQEPLVYVVQAGIDSYSMVMANEGGRLIWSANGAFNPGRKALIFFAGGVLGDTNMTSALGTKSGDYAYSEGYGQTGTWPDRITTPPDYIHFALDDQTHTITQWDIIYPPYPLFYKASFYSTGTVKVTNGYNIIEGVGTDWTGSWYDDGNPDYNTSWERYGDSEGMFGIINHSEANSINGEAYYIDEIIDSTHLSLADINGTPVNFRGETDLSGTLKYHIGYRLGYGHSSLTNYPAVSFTEFGEEAIGYPDFSTGYMQSPQTSDPLFSGVLGYRGSNSESIGEYILPMHIMGLKDEYNHDVLFDYEDRYVQLKKSLGEQGHNSALVARMWDAYRADYGCVWKEESVGSFSYDCTGCVYGCPEGDYCGDGICNDAEDSSSCAYDCIDCSIASVDTDCPDKDCYTKSCVSGNCSYAVVGDGVSCSDGLFCTGTEICQAGSCVATGNPCTVGQLCLEPDVCQDTDYPTDYIGYWRFEGNVNDETRNNNGILYRGSSPGTGTYETGVFEQALRLNGVDEYVNVGSGSTDITKNITVSAWFNTNKNQRQAIVARGSVNAVPLNQQYNLWLDLPSGYIQFVVSDGGSNYKASTSPFFVQMSTWYHAVGIWDGTKVHLYINGVLKNSANASFESMNQRSDNTLIGSKGAGSYFFNGTLDEVMIYSRALNESEIQQIYCNQGGGDINPGLCSTYVGSLSPFTKLLNSMKFLLNKETIDDEDKNKIIFIVIITSFIVIIVLIIIILIFAKIKKNKKKSGKKIGKNIGKRIRKRR